MCVVFSFITQSRKRTTLGHTFNRECEERKGKSIDNLSIDYHGQSLYK